MVQPLVEQLRFTRREFQRCLQGISAQDALVRHGQMNCISWIVGHMATHENNVFVYSAQGISLQRGLRKICGYGSPPSTPNLADMQAAWQAITAQADVFLDSLDKEKMQQHLLWRGKPLPETIGTTIQRVIYHYWFHLGEAHAIRQILGSTNLPEFVGAMDDLPFRPS